MITIDAKNERVGRLASKIAQILRGKTDPNFLPYEKPTKKVVVVNAARMDVDMRRLANIKYVRYSGYPGGKKERSVAEVFEKDPALVLRNAVRGMLPDNKLRKIALSNLVIYGEQENTDKKN